MSTVVVIMMVFMVVGFIGLGHHHDMMGGHDKEMHKEESVIPDHDHVAPSHEVPVESEPEKEKVNEGTLQNDGGRDGD